MIQSRIEYMLHNPIQYPVHSPQLPNTFTNKESVAQEDSLHNLSIEKLYSLPSTVEGGREGGY